MLLRQKTPLIDRQGYDDKLFRVVNLSILYYIGNILFEL